MRVPIQTPRFGVDTEDGRIGSWLKAVGDRVEPDAAAGAA